MHNKIMHLTQLELLKLINGEIWALSILYPQIDENNFDKKELLNAFREIEELSHLISYLFENWEDIKYKRIVWKAIGEFDNIESLIDTMDFDYKT